MSKGIYYNKRLNLASVLILNRIGRMESKTFWLISQNAHFPERETFHAPLFLCSLAIFPSEVACRWLTLTETFIFCAFNRSIEYIMTAAPQRSTHYVIRRLYGWCESMNGKIHFLKVWIFANMKIIWQILIFLMMKSNRAKLIHWI